MDLTSILHRSAQTLNVLQFVPLRRKQNGTVVQMLVESAFQPTELRVDNRSALDLRGRAQLIPVIAGRCVHAGFVVLVPKRTRILPTQIVVGEDSPKVVDESTQILYRDKHIRAVFSPRNDLLVILPCLPAPIQRLV